MLEMPVGLGLLMHLSRALKLWENDKEINEKVVSMPLLLITPTVDFCAR